MKLRVVGAVISALLASSVLTPCSDSTAPKPTLVWTAVPSGTTNNLRGVWGTSASDVWVVGDQTILHYDGVSWSPVTAAAAHVLHDV